jgi:potassium efflux system protein
MPLLRVLLCALVLSVGTIATAQVSSNASSVVAAAAQVGGVETDLRAVDRALNARVDADEQKRLRSKALAAQQVARTAIAELQDELALVEARIAELGPVPAGGGEATELRAQRSGLASRHSAIDVALRRARLADVEAQQLVDEIARSQAEQFSETISARVASPVTPAFWRALLASVPRDVRRTGFFLAQGGDEVRSRWRDGTPWPAALGGVLALIILFPARLLARRAGQIYLIEGAPGHRLRRSANGIWRVLMGTLSPLLAALIFVQGLRWAALLPDRWNGLLDAFVVAVGFGSFSAAITGAVLMRSQPSWRILPITDETARRLRPLSWTLAVLASGSILLTGFNAAVGASHPAVVAAEATVALLHLLLVIALLITLGRIRAARVAQDEADVLHRGAGLAVATLLLWVMVITALVALLLGYVGFSLFVAQFIAWATVLGCALYVLWVAADDIATTVFTRTSRVGQTFVRALGVRGSVVEQFGLLLSIVLRLMLVVIAFGLLLSPFGTGGGLGSLFGRLGTLAQGVEIGSVSISPGAILRGIVVLFVGLGIVRAFMGWLDNRYLPATDLDGSGRNSVSLVARYIGIALAGIWALASVGIGVERVALLLSALSVGIGFGLQAITQNFVSGLILLAERPIKIGDLIRVGTDEGDVKRISVRSTEIELGDHSTLIVPNSELITKPVLNKTLAGPLGRVQLQFSVPIETDVEQVRRIVLTAMVAEPGVRDDPAPVAYIDSIADGRILFNCMAHVASPRAAYSARSNILTAVLAAFRAEGIGIGTVPQRLELVTGPRPEDRG